ncbi:MtrAB system histidine kinase MtrB [Nocardioides montaniterrae]
MSSALTRAVGRPLTFWRRSIQARVVISTVLLSAVVVAAVGWMLLTHTRDGLLRHRVDVAVAEVNGEIAEASARLEAASGTEVNVGRQQRDLLDPIIERGTSRGYLVVLGPPVGTGLSVRDGGGQYTAGLDLSSVPPRLEKHFNATTTGTAWTYTRIRREASDGTRSSEPGVIVGAEVQLPSDGKTYPLYFLFPLTEEGDTLGLVTRGMLAAAALLLVLIAGISFLVIHQVVTPIREARRVAERLAAGRLQERLRVSGEDDLARLALSFNQMATNLQRQIRQLEELSWVQRRFVSDVSHELRTPLTTVRMASDHLHDARTEFDPVTARAAELLQAQLDRFEDLLIDLLEISRFDAGAAVLDPDTADLVALAGRVVEGCAPLAERQGVRVEVEAPAGGVHAQVDVRRVERILRNLVNNAIDHAEPTRVDRPVVVRLASDESAVAITVRDHGVGLGAGEAAMVFNRFWRSDPARARTTGGTGLGLAIALEDANLHGGWLQAWGRRGGGAQFRLTLPIRPGLALNGSPLPLAPDDDVLSVAADVGHALDHAEHHDDTGPEEDR